MRDSLLPYDAALTMTLSGATATLADQHVLVLHNRYRESGGEERYVSQLLDLLGERAASAGLISRSSDDSSRVAAGRALIRGGTAADESASRVAASKATILHAHNIHPAFGWRSLKSARDAGAAVVLHLHNYRLFCAIGIAYRDGHDCTDCARRKPWNGVIHNCRHNPAEAIAYAGGIGLWQQRLIDNVDLFLAPTAQLADGLHGLGFELPIEVLPTWLPTSEFAATSRAGEGSYGLFAGRVTEEKGILTLIKAAAIAGIPLRIAGDGPALADARQLVAELSAPVELLGMVDRMQLAALREGASFAVLPSEWREVLPFAAIEAQAAGLPLIVSRRGGLPELTDSELVFEPGDAESLAARISLLAGDRSLRTDAGTRALRRANDRFSERVFSAGLAAAYATARERRLNRSA